MSLVVPHGEFGEVQTEPQLVWGLWEDLYKPKLVYPDGREEDVVWAPLPGSQECFLECPVFEVLLEGNRGPGKTDALLMDFGREIGQGWGAEWRGILFRQTFPQLSDVINKSKKWFPQIWPGAIYNEAKSFWRWPTGETLVFRPFSHPDDYWDYHGHAYPWIAYEELTTWADPACYTVMMACSRSTKPGMPRRYRSTTNPYGPGHNWVKKRFNLPVRPQGAMVGKVVKDRFKSADGKLSTLSRVAIHADLAENKILLHAEPDYIEKIRQAARNVNEEKAWLYGSWDVTSGGMFDDIWDNDIHCLVPFKIPDSWRIDRSFDWGSSKPASVGWWAESDGTDLVMPDGSTRSTVRGDLFRIAEWYIWDGNHDNPGGQNLIATEIARGIVEREVRWNIEHRMKSGPADSSIFTTENGVCIATDMSQRVRCGDGVRRKGVNWLPADKSPGSRIVGWQAIRTMLKGAIPSPNGPRESPGLFICTNCEDWLRTVPTIPRDPRNPDDVDTNVEDHAADETRYKVRGLKIKVKTGSTTGFY